MDGNKKNTSWENVGGWYNKSVGDRGAYYHEHVVIPKTLKLLGLHTGDNILDLGCGQGILGRSIPSGVNYTGVDIAPTLVRYAQAKDHKKEHVYVVGDVTRPLVVGDGFTHAAIILALQNIENPAAVFQNLSRHIQIHGTVVVVLNHPCFRIPRQSLWGTDEQSKLQYRRINRYMTPLTIPVSMHPGQKQGESTWSFHNPISSYVSMIASVGFMVDAMEEWTSDKESQAGKTGKMENRARAEFPLFLAIRGRRVK
jgi:ubiquinone/menaquinone biosynthesis C-methylase UbiE